MLKDNLCHWQEMINSWSMPFLEAFRDAKNVQLYEVLKCSLLQFIDLGNI